MENKNDDCPVQMSRELFNALHADANRYRAVRALVCEPDEAKRDVMFKAVDDLMTQQHDIDEAAPTPERIDALVDQLLTVAQGARDADRQV